jgi:hypothetical protein
MAPLLGGVACAPGLLPCLGRLEAPGALAFKREETHGETQGPG